MHREKCMLWYTKFSWFYDKEAVANWSDGLWTVWLNSGSLCTVWMAKIDVMFILWCSLSLCRKSCSQSAWPNSRQVLTPPSRLLPHSLFWHLHADGTCLHAHAHTRTNKRTLSLNYSFTHSLAHTDTRTPTQIYKHTICLFLSLSFAQTHTHTHTHARTHKHTHTHTHTYTYIRVIQDVETGR